MGGDSPQCHICNVGGKSSCTCCPVARHTTFDPQVLRLLLLRRLWLPLPSSSRVCRCGRPLFSSGHHRAACAVAGVLGSRGFAVESAAARVCREAGGRVSTNIRIQDMDIMAPNLLDDRRVEVLADGLPLFHGQQLAIDTTLVSALGRDGLPRPRCAHVDGAILEAARWRKERHHLELSGQQGRTRLVVLAAEVGGRWSQESVRFLVQLAKAKVRHEPKVMRGQRSVHLDQAVAKKKNLQSEHISHPPTQFFRRVWTSA